MNFKKGIGGHILVLHASTSFSTLSFGRMRVSSRKPYRVDETVICAGDVRSWSETVKSQFQVNGQLL
jgi:hypothetical protein